MKHSFVRIMSEIRMELDCQNVVSMEAALKKPVNCSIEQRPEPSGEGPKTNLKT